MVDVTATPGSPPRSPAADPTASAPAPMPTRPAGTGRNQWTLLGPGLVLAAASVGAGDMVTSLAGAAGHGMALMWAIVIGVALKYALTEAVGRLYLATGQTVIGSLRSAARWLPAAFLLFVLVIGLLYGAALSSVASLALSTLFPVLPVRPVGVTIALAAAAIVYVGRYTVFERVMSVFMLAKFLGMAVLAVATLATADDLPGLLGTLRPRLPEGDVVTVLALVGGVGGTAGIASYSYWVREKGWADRSRLRLVRADSALSYGVTLLFVLCTTVVGTGLLYGTGGSITGSDGLAALADPLGADLGSVARVLFLGTFFLVTLSALVGGFNGLCYLLADSLRAVRGIPDAEAEPHIAQNGGPFRAFLLYCALAAVAVTFLGRPVSLVLTYAAVGSLILPLLAGALLVLLNRRGVEPALRNPITSNVLLGGSFVLFGVLAAVQLKDSLGGA
ncbi:Nramp family divalent metal transporter [Streptomyces stelliscabiei]|uniref:Nramp family divalent metal transporter n=1 Tax=Streptomyces stelliscabiei TaxID=146820 RepID=UPI0029A4ACD7|nr:Nramp family divalent metal transporter [Streptomyces stelliscabiei]MDX2552994.1 Nramp family divalent metal transporter [Streptomyces stelliscabiei]MDX2611982.1 Nramp family divalent metal transporter [Streptomyces stelliscabiei]MDX2636320.1 Nramp family divalent metal transporter [Streptomyces stelliscabiei]MDX2667043.1 Nramp family divalent metal transporter [Streptomyces stelliscabiei]MDX2717607.1 Nramp family divalent metal transporter [Streptomyces stelliscabiei]